ncbi:MAG: leucine-rich repeat domain-containing protein [Candidatus Lokiarchaeota archaeon]
MTSFSNSSKFYNEYLRGKITKEEFINYLLIDFSQEKDDIKRLSLLNLMSRELIKNAKTYSFLEHIIISDEDAKLRARSIEIIVNNFLFQSENLLKWVLEHDNTLSVIRTILRYKKLYPVDFYNLKKAQENWMGRISNKLDISKKEILFYLDSEVNIVNNRNQKLDETTFEFYKEISSNQKPFFWILKVNNHIIELHYHFYAWKFLRNNLRLITQLRSLKNYILFVNTFWKMRHLKEKQYGKIPKSIGILKQLKVLDLSFNNLNRVPSFLVNLKKLEFLDLSNNNIKIIPEFLKKIPNLKKIRFDNNPVDKE